MCIHRIPRGLSIVRPGSCCPRCGARIRFYDNLPLVSFLVLRGRCRACGGAISLQYPAVEAVTALLSLLIFSRTGWSFQYVAYLLFASALILISTIDLSWQIIPDIISIPGIFAGLLYTLLWRDPPFAEALIGALAGGGGLFVVAFLYERLRGQMGLGGGDIKLLAMIGAWLGWRALPWVVLVGSLTGAVAGTLFLLISKKDLKTRIPFGPFLSLGAIFHLLFGSAVTRGLGALFSLH